MSGLANKKKQKPRWGDYLRLVKKTSRSGAVTYSAQEHIRIPGGDYWRTLSGNYNLSSCCEVSDFLDQKYGRDVVSVEVINSCDKE